MQSRPGPASSSFRKPSSAWGIWAFIFPSGKILRDHSYDTGWLCVKIMLLFFFFEVLALLFSSESPVQPRLLSVFTPRALSIPCVPVLSSVLFPHLSSYWSASSLPFSPLDPPQYIPLATWLYLTHLLFFSLTWWFVPFPLSGPKELDLMWQIFPLHNDGLGRKKWLNFPNSQQLEGVPSTNVSWLFFSILIFFLSI